jgi:hypothetical protein
MMIKALHRRMIGLGKLADAAKKSASNCADQES